MCVHVEDVKTYLETAHGLLEVYSKDPQPNIYNAQVRIERLKDYVSQATLFVTNCNCLEIQKGEWQTYSNNLRSEVDKLQSNLSSRESRITQLERDLQISKQEEENTLQNIISSLMNEMSSFQ